MDNLTELHKSACLAEYKLTISNGAKLTLEQEAILIVKRLASGAIDRNKVKRLIDSHVNSEGLRNLINEYRGKV